MPVRYQDCMLIRSFDDKERNEEGVKQEFGATSRTLKTSLEVNGTTHNIKLVQTNLLGSITIQDILLKYLG